MALEKDYVGVLSEMKYYLADDMKQSTYSGNLKFQGSNDGKTYVDLYTADEEVHSGWNYIAWEKAEDQPKYRYYRFYGTEEGSCVLSEAQLWGVSTIDSNTKS
jgi:hypothetical protein